MTFLAETPVLFAILLIFNGSVFAQNPQGAAPTSVVSSTSTLPPTNGQSIQPNASHSAAIAPADSVAPKTNITAPVISVASQPNINTSATQTIVSPATVTSPSNTTSGVTTSQLPTSQASSSSPSPVGQTTVNSGALPHAHSAEVNVKPTSNQIVAAAQQPPENSQSSTSQPQPYSDPSNPNKATIGPSASGSLSPLAISLIVVAALGFVAAVLGFIGYRYTTNDRRRSN